MSETCSRTGVVFDVQEFSVNDGPGVRVTVFLKGCPLRCRWCHNPEGISPLPQKNLLTGHLVGERWSVEDLSNYLLQFKDVFALTNGGVTFSGGEATMQSEFLFEVACCVRNEGVHVNLDTCGHCTSDVFRGILNCVDLVYYDLKCMDAELHKKMTGVDNALILDNIRLLAQSDVPYRIRIPLIPGVSDTQENRAETEQFVASLSRSPEGVDWLAFNEMSGAKYSAYGMRYEFSEK